ncbi:MAG: flagellar protein FlaG [Steroidobacter sp.]
MNTIDAKALFSMLNGSPGSGGSSVVRRIPAALSALSANNVADAASAPPSESDLQAAAQQIQGYLSGHTDPPQYAVDYLSGLQVMTVRNASSGEVVFQLPNSEALRLAQLLHEGAAVNTVGIVNAEA